MEKELIKCSKISVDCVYNDPVDVAIGGPECLGFDFFVRDEEVDSIQKFIKQTLEEVKVPLISIGVVKKDLFLAINKIWDKKRIAQYILSEADYLISQASCNYKPSQKTKIR